jgi:hypothetical protein
MRVGIAGRVEPVAGHPLAIAGRRQQPINGPLVGIGGRIGQMALDVVDRRPHANEIEGHPPQKRQPVGFRRRRQFLVHEPPGDEQVDRVSRPAAQRLQKHR